MPLEDDFCDIIKKARMGHAWSVADVTRTTGLAGGEITSLERGARLPDRNEVRALAKALGLRPGPLEQIVIEQWEPALAPPVSWIETVRGSIGGYGVQGYVVHDGGGGAYRHGVQCAGDDRRFVSAPPAPDGDLPHAWPCGPR